MAQLDIGADRWKDLFWWLYNFTPPVTDKVRRYCAPAAALLRNLRIPLILLHGNSLAGTESAVVAAGDILAANYIGRRFFRGEPTSQPLKPVPIHRLNKVLREWAPRVDLVYARVDRITAQVFNADYLTMPGSLSLLTTLPDTLKQLERMNSNVKEDVRKIRENSLNYEISRGCEGFDEFYDRYHIPAMRSRHGANAVIRNRHLLRRLVASGGIIWITHEGRRIAASAFQHHPNVLSLVGAGLQDGRLDFMRLGALSAVYYFASCYAMEQGCKHIEMGSTAPYLADGLMQYKRKWRPNVSIANSAYSGRMHWPQLSDAVIEFLASSSPIFVEGDKLSAITALRSAEPATSEQAVKLFSQQAVLGLRRFWFVSRSGWQSTETTHTIDQTELKMVQTFQPHQLAGGR